VSVDVSAAADWKEYRWARVAALDAADKARVLAQGQGSFYRRKAQVELAAPQPREKSGEAKPEPAAPQAPNVVLRLEYLRPDGTRIGEPVEVDVKGE
jgi:hypothetical protein